MTKDNAIKAKTKSKCNTNEEKMTLPIEGVWMKCIQIHDDVPLTFHVTIHFFLVLYVNQDIYFIYIRGNSNDQR